MISVSKLKDFTAAMQNDHKAFENKYTSSTGGNVATGSKITVNGPITLTAVTHTYTYKVNFSSCLTGLSRKMPTNKTST